MVRKSTSEMAKVGYKLLTLVSLKPIEKTKKELDPFQVPTLNGIERKITLGTWHF